MITGIGVASIYNRSNAKKNTGVSVVGRYSGWSMPLSMPQRLHALPKRS